jgi:hypothetical protein
LITVAALMATTSKRAAFRPRAVECFRQQIFPADWQVDLLVDEQEINTLGRKLNDMTARTTADYLITWDDDDFHSPTRIARQIAPLVTGEYGYSGTSTIFYHNIITDEGWLYTGTPRIWLGGIAFTRSLWEKLKFMDRTVGVDIRIGRRVNLGYTKGNGSGQPNGIIPEVVAYGSGSQIVTAVGANSTNNPGATDLNSVNLIDDLDALITKVDPAYRIGAKFMAHQSTLDTFRKQKDGFGRPLWNVSVSEDEPDTIYGYGYGYPLGRGTESTE